nr:MmgE/PrpD family protein [Actinomycetota bacterium]
HDGTVVEEAVLANRGGTERPLAYSELAAKFRDNVAGLLEADASAQVEARIAALEELDSLEPIFELLKGLGRE